MNNFSFDLLLGVVIALFFLYQYVMQRIRASRQEQRGAPEELPPGPLEQREAAQWQWELPASTAAPVVMPAMPAPVHRPERREAPPTRRRRRFSRDALFGDRHKLQDAVVIAAVLGPSRAVEPHDIRQ